LGGFLDIEVYNCASHMRKDLNGKHLQQAVKTLNTKKKFKIIKHIATDPYLFSIMAD
jgi:hypothetical protein